MRAGRDFMEKRSIKVDIAVFAGVVIIGAVLAGVFLLGKKPGKTVVVSIDGKAIATYPLDEDRQELLIGKDRGTNRLIITKGEAWIDEADCPDKLCVHQGKISNVNESIVCLPHRITVRIEGSDAGEAPDALAK